MCHNGSRVQCNSMLQTTRCCPRLPARLCCAQNWAVLDEAVQSLGCKHTTDALFASPGQLLEAASALTPGGNSEAQAAFEAAVASLSCAALGRQCLARAAPASVLLLLPGRRHAGVADIMAVQHAGPGEVALTLALVASPVMVSELEEHAHQSLAHAPHYHFHTPAGVEVDAAAFLDALHELQLAPPGARQLAHAGRQVLSACAGTPTPPPPPLLAVQSCTCLSRAPWTAPLPRCLAKFQTHTMPISGSLWIPDASL